MLSYANWWTDLSLQLIIIKYCNIMMSNTTVNDNDNIDHGRHRGHRHHDDRGETIIFSRLKTDNRYCV